MKLVITLAECSMKVGNCRNELDCRNRGKVTDIFDKDCGEHSK